MLDIESPAEFSDVITGLEYHTYKPFSTSSFGPNDEIRISIGQQDIITAPFLSTLHITGTLNGKKADGQDSDIALINNAMAYLFSELRYEIGGVEIDRTKNVGITSTIKNLLSIQKGEVDHLINASWAGIGNTIRGKTFSFSVPLNLLSGFFEDYKRIILHARQELILLRSSTDINSLLSTNTTEHSLNITSISWRVPQISISEVYRLKLLRLIEKDVPLPLMFRTWSLFEYPELPQTDKHSWTIKSSSQLEKPRYIIVAFQTDRKNQLSKDMSQFDACGLTNLKVYLNSQYYPYDPQRGDSAIFYEMFNRFQSSYYGRQGWPAITLNEFKTKTPLYIVNCNHQNENMLSSSSIDVRLEFECSGNVSAKTVVYCLVIHDNALSYTPLTSTVRKMM